MTRPTRTAMGCLVLAAALGVAGCVSPRSDLAPTTASLADDLKPFSAPGSVRMQRAERPISAPPAGGGLTTATEQNATVRAHVNGTPLFDAEIMNMIGGELDQLYRGKSGVSTASLTEKQAKIYNDALDFLIDQEVVYQDAIRKLSKSNPKAIAKLKEIAVQETDKRIDRFLKIAADKGQKVPPETVKEITPMLMRQFERSIVYNEYMRSRAKPPTEARVGLTEVAEYYETHKNEFVTVDRVEWQDVFLAVGPKYPTLADARRAAEEMIATVRRPEDFAKLTPFDDGDSKFRGGKGFGARRGEIKPAELEEHLFKMRKGEIGPIVEISTGVHMFRLTHRDYGGQLPLTEEVQRKIREKLMTQVYEREVKRIVRELRERAVIEIDLN
ncbi:MAG: peptidylprolyl isomerase [Gemmataceae bacterium]